MTNQNTDTKYTLTDIEQYLQGKLSPAQMHEFEKAALQDPFLADALEGYQSVDTADVKKDLADLHQQLLLKTPAKVVNIPGNKLWWKIAASVIIIAGMGAITWKLLLGNNDDNPELAMQTHPAKTFPETNSLSKKISPVIEEKAVDQKNNRANDPRKPEPVMASAKPADASIPALRNQPVEKNFAKDTFANTARLRDNTSETLNEVAVAPAKKRSSADAKSYASGIINYSKTPVKESELTPQKSVINNPSLAKTHLAVAGETVRPVNADRMSAFTTTGNITLNPSRLDGSAATAGTLTIGDRIPGETFSGTLAQLTYAPNPSVKIKADTVTFSESSFKRVPNSNSKESYTASNAARPALVFGDNVRRREVHAVDPMISWTYYKNYLRLKIANATHFEDSAYGVIDIKIDIAANGKVAKAEIVHSYDPKLNSTLIDAIKKGSLWIVDEAKKDVMLSIDLRIGNQ